MANIFELKDMAKTAVSENDHDKTCETFNLILRNSSEALPEDKEFLDKLNEALKLLREYKRVNREINTIENRKMSLLDRRGDLIDEADYVNKRFDRFVEKNSKKNSPRSYSSIECALLLFLAIVLLAGALWGWWTLIVTGTIIVIIVIILIVNKISNMRDLKKMIASTEKRVAEFDAELEAKKNEREKILSEYNKKADEIISMVS
ncbi:MAG: hypothetical protein K6G47_02475 [Clostridia bacterium]|nr:hypothetical protein [Clostridia bacterium]